MRFLALARSAFAAALCSLLIIQTAFSLSGAPVPRVVSTASITGDERILHALNRFTFGPTPGDLEVVKRTGLDRWFEQQLNPSRLDNSDLQARLAEFPAMQLGLNELIRRFPGPQTIRAMERTGVSMPTDPIERAIYTDQMAFYRLKEKQIAQKSDADEMQMNDLQMTENTASMEVKKAAKIKTAGGDPERIPQEYQQLLSLPPQQRIDRILAMRPDELVTLHGALNPQRLLLLAQGMTPAQREILGAISNPVRMISAEEESQKLIREIYSSHQLEEVMTDFWMNHFNVYIKKSQQEPYYLVSYERDVIRPHALGNFEDLLTATAKSPAMLTYLDNFQSAGPNSLAATRTPRFMPAAMQKRPTGLNENYARELMELHTLGVNGGYTQKDVTEVAKVFTGWTLDKPFQGASFNFEDRRHEPGSKQVLGKMIREDGDREGLEVLHMLATSPSTAHFISQKLAVRFVSDHPSDALVNRMSQSFTASHGDIKTVLRTMFRSREFWAKDTEHAKMKTPLEFMVSAVRATGADVVNPLPLVQAMQTLGMPLYGAMPPTGYSWTQDTWMNTSALVTRMNFGLNFAHGNTRGVIIHLPAEVAQNKSVESKEQALEIMVLGRSASATTRKTVLDQFSNTQLQQQTAYSFQKASDGMAEQSPMPAQRGFAPPQSTLDNETANMLGLLIGSPDFQRR